MPLTIGNAAPGFTLYAHDKQEVKLQDHFGKPVVLLFIPAAFTGVCTAEFCEIRDQLSYFNDLDTTVLGISVDSPFALEEFHKQQNLNFLLLSDFNKTVSTAYDCLHEDFAFGMKGVSKRSVFLIDKEGKLAYQEILDVPTNMPNFEALKTALENV